MSLIFDKTLALLAMPLGVAFLASLLALLARLCKRRRLALGLLVTGLVWLWAWSTPLISQRLRPLLIDPPPAASLERMAGADAIVLLSAASDGAIFLHAADLYRAGLAPTVVLSGVSAWAPRPAAHMMPKRKLLEGLGLPPAAILVEDRSRNTRQNALATAALAAPLGIERVLLVTSRHHMPRALAAFRRAGLRPLPAPPVLPDYEAPPLPARMLPNIATLAQSSQSIHEWVGTIAYRLRGWI